MREKKRNSSYEFIKMIAIVFIVFSHGVPEVLMGASSNHIQVVMLMIAHSLGQLGNVMFVTCSAFFLLESKVVSIRKIILIIFNSFIISVSFLVIYMIIGIEIPLKYVIKSFMPTVFGNWWFIPCYLLLYTVHPLLNQIIYSIRKETLLLCCTCFLLLYGIAYFFTRGRGLCYSDFIGFMGIYFLTAFYKLYSKKVYSNRSLNKTIIFICAFILVFEIVITNLIGLKILVISSRVHMWSEFMNPAIIFMALSMTGLAGTKKFYNRFINGFSELSLLIYLIHANNLTMDIIRPWYFDKIGDQHIFLGGGVYSLICLFVATLLAKIYHMSINKIVERISVKSELKIKEIYCKYEQWVITHI